MKDKKPRRKQKVCREPGAMQVSREWVDHISAKLLSMSMDIEDLRRLQACRVTKLAVDQMLANCRHLRSVVRGENPEMPRRYVKPSTRIPF